jgi:hypothetical protein
MKNEDIIVVAIFLVVALSSVASVAILISQKLDCDKAGGVFVRSLSWYECVVAQRTGAAK